VRRGGRPVHCHPTLHAAVSLCAPAVPTSLLPLHSHPHYSIIMAPGSSPSRKRPTSSAASPSTDAAIGEGGDDGDGGNVVSADPGVNPSAVPWSFFDPRHDGSNENEPAGVAATPKRLCQDRPTVTRSSF
jgi:hypothetical protein